MVCVTGIRNTHDSSTQGPILEAFLDGVLSPGQISYIIDATVKSIVFEAHYDNPPRGGVRTHIRLRAMLIGVPQKYWTMFVLPGLERYAKQWNCRFEYHLYAFKERVVFFYLTRNPFAYKRYRHQRKEYIVTFKNNTDYSESFYVVKASSTAHVRSKLDSGRLRTKWSMIYRSREEAGVYAYGLTQTTDWR